MREKELRLALVCYGGVSLAVYMHGITKEVWKLCRASMRRRHTSSDTLPPADDSETVYAELLDAIAPMVSLTVSTDIIAGASAGGINGIFLAQAIATGQSLDPLRTLWLEAADSDHLLDPAGASRRFSKLWALPLIAWTRSRGLGMEADEPPDVAKEAGAKLSRLMRSRWFHPPFSGVVFTDVIYEALLAMAATPATPPLLPAQQQLDLFVTVTDYNGRAVPLSLHSPARILETEHRLVLGFQSPGADHSGQRWLGDPAELAFAGRATASFPGAFPPARLAEVDAVLAAREAIWPSREAFLARNFPGNTDPGSITLIDGSVLNSRPFGPAIEVLAQHRALREVDRRFVYVDPKPGMHTTAKDPARLPGFFATVLRSVADIPRQQPINDNLAVIGALSARVRRLRAVTEGMAGEVDAAIEAAVGRRFFVWRLTPERLASWRSKGQTAAATRAGFAYAAYAQLKLAGLVESLAATLSALGGGTPEALRAVLAKSLAEQGLDQSAQAQARGGASSPFVLLLRRFDIEFRVRRLRFMVRRINALAPGVESGTARAALEVLKDGLYVLIDAHLAARNPARLAGDSMLSLVAASALAEPTAALEALAQALDLQTLDRDSDERFAQMFEADMPRPLRRDLLNAYLGFPFYDIATLPLLAGDGSDEFDEIKVDRLSPLDCTALAAHGGTSLKGARLNAFGAFFSRAYREHDYLWGRLHGAERMIDIVASAAPAPPPGLEAIKTRAFLAILASERESLGRSTALIDRLEAALAAEGQARPGAGPGAGPGAEKSAAAPAPADDE